MTKATTRARHTLEFKQEAVRLIEGSQSIAAAARTLGVVDQTLFNWVKAHRAGRFTGVDSTATSATRRCWCTPRPSTPRRAAATAGCGPGGNS